MCRQIAHCISDIPQNCCEYDRTPDVHLGFPIRTQTNIGVGECAREDNDLSTILIHTSNDPTTIPIHASTDLTTFPTHAPSHLIAISTNATNDLSTIPIHTSNDITIIPTHTSNDFVTIPTHTSYDLNTIPTHALNVHTTVPTHAPSDLTTVPTHAANDLTTIPTHAPYDLTTIHTHALNVHTTVPTHAPSDLTTIPTHAANDLTTIPTHAPFDLTAIPTHVPCDLTTTYTNAHAPNILTTIPADTSCDLTIIHSMHVPQKRIAELGTLNFEFRYILPEKRFMVVLIKGEDIGGRTKQNSDMSMYVKLWLGPMKQQMQISEVIARSHQPSILQTFFFDVTLHDVQMMSLCMKVYNKMALAPEAYIGGIAVGIGRYNVKETTRIWMDLKGRNTDKGALGYLHVGLKIKIESSELCVSIGRAKGLSQTFSAGPPNSYVCVEVYQNFARVAQLRTHTTRNTCSPSFKQMMTFTLAHIDEEGLKRTSVVISVFHRDVCSDRTLGQIRLGYDCTEVSEVLHWSEALLRPGTEIKRWHKLLESGDVFKYDINLA